SSVGDKLGASSGNRQTRGPVSGREQVNSGSVWRAAHRMVDTGMMASLPYASFQDGSNPFEPDELTKARQNCQFASTPTPDLHRLARSLPVAQDVACLIGAAQVTELPSERRQQRR